MKTKSVLPRKRSIIKAGNVFFLYVSERKLMHGIRHDLQCPAASGAFSSFAFVRLDPCFFYHRLRQFHPTARESRVDEKERWREFLNAAPAHHEMIARHPNGNYDFFAWRFFKFFQVLRVFPAEHKLAMRIIHCRQEMVKQSGPDDSVDLFHAKSF